MQAAGTYQSSARSLLSSFDNVTAGNLPAYGSVDVSLGVAGHAWNASLNVENVSDAHGDISRYLACSYQYCTNPYVIPLHPRMYTLQFGQKF